MEAFSEILTATGALLGVFAFFWKVLDSIKSFLHIKVEVIGGHGTETLKVKTTVENRGNCPKRIDNALLLIGPEHECPVKTANTLCPESMCSFTNDIINIQNELPISDREGRMLIPIPFYYSENVKIGDEELSFSIIVSKDNFIKRGSYSVRFYIGAFGRYHRSNQDSFSIN